MGAGAGETVEVVRNDAAGAGELLARQPLGIVVSPGPGRPEGAGVCVELIRRALPVPLLGVCLGHQALAFAYGGGGPPAPPPTHRQGPRPPPPPPAHRSRLPHPLAA